MAYDYIYLKPKVGETNQFSLGTHTHGIKLSRNGEVNDLQKKSFIIDIWRGWRQEENAVRESYIGTLKIIVMFYFLTLKVSALVFLLLFLKIHVYLEYILWRTVKKGKRNKQYRGLAKPNAIVWKYRPTCYDWKSEK